MHDTSPTSPARSRRRGSYHRWSAADPAAHLARFAASGLTVTAYCAQTGVPRSTLELWRRDARTSRPPVPRAEDRAFAAVQVVPAPPGAAALTELPATSGVMMRVYLPSGIATELAGLDATTTLALVRLLLVPLDPARR